MVILERPTLTKQKSTSPNVSPRPVSPRTVSPPKERQIGLQRETATKVVYDELSIIGELGRRYIPQEVIRVAPSQLFEKIEVKPEAPPVEVKPQEVQPESPPEPELDAAVSSEESSEHVLNEPPTPSPEIQSEKPAKIIEPVAVVEKPKEPIVEKKGLVRSGEHVLSKSQERPRSLLRSNNSDSEHERTQTPSPVPPPEYHTPPPIANSVPATKPLTESFEKISLPQTIVTKPEILPLEIPPNIGERKSKKGRSQSTSSPRGSGASLSSKKQTSVTELKQKETSTEEHASPNKTKSSPDFSKITSKIRSHSTSSPRISGITGIFPIISPRKTNNNSADPPKPAEDKKPKEKKQQVCEPARQERVVEPRLPIFIERPDPRDPPEPSEPPKSVEQPRVPPESRYINPDPRPVNPDPRYINPEPRPINPEPRYNNPEPVAPVKELKQPFMERPRNHEQPRVALVEPKETYQTPYFARLGEPQLPNRYEQSHDPSTLTKAHSLQNTTFRQQELQHSQEKSSTSPRKLEKSSSSSPNLTLPLTTEKKENRSTSPRSHPVRNVGRIQEIPKRNQEPRYKPPELTHAGPVTGSSHPPAVIVPAFLQQIKNQIYALMACLNKVSAFTPKTAAAFRTVVFAATKPLKQLKALSTHLTSSPSPLVRKLDKSLCQLLLLTTNYLRGVIPGNTLELSHSVEQILALIVHTIKEIVKLITVLE